MSNSLPRPIFQQAIQAGIRRAGVRLSPEEVGRLQQVAARAEAFDTNFAPGEAGRLNCGCPGSQANLTDDWTLGWASPLCEFACGFDDFLIGYYRTREIDPLAYAKMDRIEVAS